MRTHLSEDTIAVCSDMAVYWRVKKPRKRGVEFTVALMSKIKCSFSKTDVVAKDDLFRLDMNVRVAHIGERGQGITL